MRAKERVFPSVLGLPVGKNLGIGGLPCGSLTAIVFCSLIIMFLKTKDRREVIFGTKSCVRTSHTGILFVVSAPSGAGKSTLCANLRQEGDFIYAASCTTRPPRPGEISGEDYHFLSEEAFRSHLIQGEFLEYAEVHGQKYGTLKSTIIDHLKKGVDVLIDIDTQGAASIRSCKDLFILQALADIFIMPPGLGELRRRLVRRGTENEEQIRMRLAAAKLEMCRWKEYKYTIVSGSMEEDIAKFRAVIRAERYLSRRLLLETEAATPP